MNFEVISKSVLEARKKIVYMQEHIKKEERHPKSEKFYATNGFKNIEEAAQKKETRYVLKQIFRVVLEICVPCKKCFCQTNISSASEKLC